jgi:hypothetical protein
LFCLLGWTATFFGVVGGGRGGVNRNGLTRRSSTRESSQGRSDASSRLNSALAASAPEALARPLIVCWVPRCRSVAAVVQSARSRRSKATALIRGATSAVMLIGGDRIRSPQTDVREEKGRRCEKGASTADGRPCQRRRATTLSSLTTNDSRTATDKAHDASKTERARS